MPENELGYGKSSPFDIRKIYFEVTPARLIATWCTENGIVHDPAGLTRLSNPSSLV
jgi:translation initiation factor 2B subunit (eIF-2B alpha/beta/delta family)